MKTTLAVLRKDLSLLLREPHTLLFALGFPLVFGVFFGAVFSDAATERIEVRCYIVDADGSERSRSLIAALGEEDGLALTVVDSEAFATERVGKGSVPAALVVRSGFGDALGDTDPSEPRLTLLTDPSQQGAASMVRGIVSSIAARQRARAVASALGGPVGASIVRATEADALVVEPVVPEGRPVNAYELTFSQAMVWAIMGCAAAFSVSLVRERAAGTMTRLRLAPGGVRAAILGKSLACTAVSVAAASLFALLGIVGFGVRPESPALLVVGVLLAAFAFSGVMMLVAVVARGHQSPGQVAWGLLLLFALTGGGMLPLAFMPPWLSAISYASPVRWAILAIEAGVWRGFSWAEALPALGALTAVAVSTMVVGLVWFAGEREG